ncbi:MAG: hypothetical protein RI920_514 [Pseudomonadota bacterium]
MIVYIHASDMEDRGMAFRRHRGLSDVHHITLTPFPDFNEIIPAVIAALPGQRSLYLLVVNCHGVNVPNHYGPDHPAIGLALSQGPALPPSDLGIFAGLRGYFSDVNQGIELHACQIARGRHGRAYCMRLANEAGVTVYGGLDSQNGTGPGFDTDDGHLFARWCGEVDSWGYYEGPVLAFEPGGTFHDASAALRARGAWRAGTPELAHHRDITAWQADNPLDEPDVSL